VDLTKQSTIFFLVEQSNQCENSENRDHSIMEESKRRNFLFALKRYDIAETSITNPPD